LFEREGGDGTFVALADPLEGEVVAVGVERVWGGESVETRLGEAPEKSVSFEIERGAFAIGLRPAFRPPDDVKAAGVVVGDGVGAVIGGELNSCFCG
jgi:hypothetical protein